VLAVRESGGFTSFCAFPCDSYSMSHGGYMRGTITAI
jgi:hypothetical protein